MATDARARRHGRNEAQFVEAIVDAHLGVALDIHRLGGHTAQQGYREKAMRDGAAEGRLPLGPFHVHVNPLMIAGDVGKAVDHVLGHVNPAADAGFLAHELG